MRSISGKAYIAPYPVALLFTVVTLVLEWLLMDGCGGPFRYPRAINEEDGRYVRLEARYGRGQHGERMPFAHPIFLSEAEWAHILAGLYVQPNSWFLSRGATEGGPRLALDESDRQYLAKYLSESFAKARPDEWVLFYLSHPQEPGITEITSGGIFVDGGQIHLMMANYRFAVSMGIIRQQIWEDPLHSIGETFYDIIPQSNQALRDEKRRGLTKLLTAQIPELLIDYSAFLALPDKTTASKDPLSPESAISPGSETHLEHKLRTLQRLREQGLITEEEYWVSRKKLLEEL